EKQQQLLAATLLVNCAQQPSTRRTPASPFPPDPASQPIGETPAAARLGVGFPGADPLLRHQPGGEPPHQRLPLTLLAPAEAGTGLRIAHTLTRYAPGAAERCDSFALLQGGREYWLACPQTGGSGAAACLLSVYAGRQADPELSCVYRCVLLASESPPSAPPPEPFPLQTSLFCGCRLVEPLAQRLPAGRTHAFRLEAPGFRALSLVLNDGAA
uniref:TRAF-type domain-containing protein n=1 Tax=Macrostomum lignano TaxID=282301 RepID=A0A1I8H849_9PLAT